MIVDSSTFKATDSNAFFFGAQALLCIDAQTGRIGVGTSNPARRLDVAGDVVASGNVDVGQLYIGGAPFTDSITYPLVGPIERAHLDLASINRSTLPGTLPRGAFADGTIPYSAIDGDNSASFVSLVLDTLTAVPEQQMPGFVTLSNLSVRLASESNLLATLASTPGDRLWPSLSNGVTYAHLGQVPSSAFADSTVRSTCISDPMWSRVAGSMSNVFATGCNVGIGTSNPSFLLHVIGQDLASNPTTIMTNGDIVAYSDATIKTDVKVIEHALEKIGRVGGYTYLRTDVSSDGAGQRRMAGVIAQEMQQVLPEVVYSDPASGKLAVAYGSIIPLLIQGIKELETKVDALASLVGS